MPSILTQISYYGKRAETHAWPLPAYIRRTGAEVNGGREIPHDAHDSVGQGCGGPCQVGSKLMACLRRDVKCPGGSCPRPAPVRARAEKPVSRESALRREPGRPGRGHPRVARDISLRRVT